MTHACSRGALSLLALLFVTSVMLQADPALAQPEACSSGTVTFDTSDGVKLEADFETTGKPNGPVVVLLHMIPPKHTRKNYPPAFVDALVERGISVLNVDRRGAGGSEGEPKEAYKGDKGKLDAIAAVEWLRASPCNPDLDALVFIGASNGTTTSLDYAVAAASDDKLPSPAAIVFLTGGKYTEAQHKLSDVPKAVAATPILFVYSTKERKWSAGILDAEPPEAWVFKEYPEDGHGTIMFKGHKDSLTEVADFVATHTGAKP